MTTSRPGNSDHEQPLLPGRLADPQRVLRTDPRTDPRILTALAPFGLDEAPAVAQGYCGDMTSPAYCWLAIH